MTTRLAIGVAANAQPIGEIGDKAGFDECMIEHPDDNGFAVCCVFYGGSLDEGNDACYYRHEEEASGPTPPTRPGTRLLTGVSVASITGRRGRVDAPPYSMQETQPSTSVPSSAIWRSRM